MDNLFSDGWQERLKEEEANLLPEEREMLEKIRQENIEKVRNIPTFEELGFKSENEQEAYGFAVRSLLDREDLTQEERNRILSAQTKAEKSRLVDEYDLIFLLKRRLSMNDVEKMEVDLYRNQEKLEKYVQEYEQKEKELNEQLNSIKKR